MKSAQEVVDEETSQTDRRAGLVIFCTWPEGGGEGSVDVAFNGPEGMDIRMAELLLREIKRRRRVA